MLRTSAFMTVKDKREVSWEDYEACILNVLHTQVIILLIMLQFKRVNESWSHNVSLGAFTQI